MKLSQLLGATSGLEETNLSDLQVIFEIQKNGQSAEESFSIDRVELRGNTLKDGAFLVLISDD